MITPTESLVFSMHANPGVYAVLAGSGVSRAAIIPTGWEITLSLVNQLAHVRQLTCEPGPEEWYRNTFGKEPDYSELLDALTGTPTERQALLRDYIEPSADERDERAKQPTAAHRAIAALAVNGTIRVILTTNFDCLIQTALEEAGVTPTVLSTPDQLRGVRPLIHGGCWVIKLHGDYRDIRIRNTQAELDSYDPKFNDLLDRILDEFGLIVCGWSAVWDGALRDALYRAPARRFTTYWAVHGDITDEAQQLIDHRAAKSIPITDADEFFRTVQEQVESLREFARPHPLSTEGAIASLKRYLPEPQHRIRLWDLVDCVVERAVQATSGEGFAMDSPTPDPTTLRARLRRYDAAYSTLLALAPFGGFWAEEDHVTLWQRALTRLSETRPIVGQRFDETWNDLRRYPGVMLLYALGIGALGHNRLPFVGRLLKTSVPDRHDEDTTAVQVLNPLLFNDVRIAVSETTTDRTMLLNSWMLQTLRPHVAPVVPDDSQYTLLFHKLQVLLALGYIHTYPDRGWAPIGPIGHFRKSPNDRIVQEIDTSLSAKGHDSPFARCGIFGDTKEVCTQRLTSLRELIAGRPRW